MRVPGTPVQTAMATGQRLAAPEDKSGLILGRAVHGLGETVSRLAAQWQDQEDHDSLVAAQNGYTQKMQSWMLEQEGSRQGAAARGLTQDFRAKHKAVLEETVRDNRMSSRARKAFETWGLSRESAGLSVAARMERQEMVRFGQDQHALRVQGIFDNLEHVPGQWRDGLKQLEESFALAVGQGIYRPEEAQLRFRDAANKLKAASFENLYALDRGQAMSSLAAYGFSPKQVAVAKKRYAADVRADAAHARAVNAEAAENLRFDLKDAEVLAQGTGNTSALRAVAGKFQALGQARQAAHILAEADRYDARYGDIREAQTMPLPELAADLARRRDEAAGLTDAAAYALASDRLKIRSGVFDARVKALKEDPAGAVDSMAAGDTPEARAASRLSVQGRQGVPLGAQRVLTASEAAGMRAALRDGDMEKRLAVGAGLQQYGRFAGKAAAEAGLGPAAQIALRQADKDRQRANLPTVLAAENARDADLPQLSDKATLQRQARENSRVLRGYAAFARALPGLASVQGQVRRLEDTLDRLVLMTGGDVEAAVASLDGRYDTLADGRAALVYDPAAIDGDVLEAGLTAALDSRLEKFADGMTFAGKFDRADRLADLRRGGIWANAPDGQGYVLFDPVAQAPVQDDQGRVFRITDDEARVLHAKEKDTAALHYGGFW